MQILDKHNTESEPVIFVVDDDAAIRDSLRLLLESMDRKVETYESAQDFLNNANRNLPGCIILDVRMPGISGLELQDKLNEMHTDLPVIFITGHGEIPMAVNTMRKGAFDFIQKPFSASGLVERIDKALQLNHEIRDQRHVQHDLEELFAALTHRELEVLDLIVEGKSNKYIAYELELSQRTIEAHRSHIMEKLHVKSLAELVRLVVSYKTHQEKSESDSLASEPVH